MDIDFLKSHKIVPSYKIHDYIRTLRFRQRIDIKGAYVYVKFDTLTHTTASLVYWKPREIDILLHPNVKLRKQQIRDIASLNWAEFGLILKCPYGLFPIEKIPKRERNNRYLYYEAVPAVMRALRICNNINSIKYRKEIIKTLNKKHIIKSI